MAVRQPRRKSYPTKANVQKNKSLEAASKSKSSKTNIDITPQKVPRPLKESQLSGNKIQCWAHTKTGSRCCALVSSREGEPVPVPYCEKHMKCGDGALKVVNHPIAGKCLVARFDLPKRYRMAFWGKRGRCKPADKEDRAICFFPPDKITGKNRNKDGTLKQNYNGVLNPGGTGDILQYAACPGPNERQNVKSTSQYWGLRNGNIGGLEFVTLEPVRRNTQLIHWYGAGWWKERGLKRVDVGTSYYPAPLRVGRNKM